MRVRMIYGNKTFVVSKQSVEKKYGTLNKNSYELCLDLFCKYFGCMKR
jgi:hypothetical protein